MERIATVVVALAFAGLAIGIPVALGATRVLSNFLYGVTAADPLMFSATSLLLSAVALAATYVPARRATVVLVGVNVISTGW